MPSKKFSMKNESYEQESGSRNNNVAKKSLNIARTNCRIVQNNLAKKSLNIARTNCRIVQNNLYPVSIYLSIDDLI